MDVTGLIYVAIVALWAAVLIPMWLRRHDDDQARRIERHRVAMGTLARIGSTADDTRALAGRRRRLVLAGTATIGALGTAAWIAGLAPGLLTASLWLPFVAFLPIALVSERRASRRAAERALQASRSDRDRVRRERRAAEQVAPEPARDIASARPAAPRPVWDEVFDQSA